MPKEFNFSSKPAVRAPTGVRELAEVDDVDILDEYDNSSSSWASITDDHLDCSPRLTPQTSAECCDPTTGTLVLEDRVVLGLSPSLGEGVRVLILVLTPTLSPRQERTRRHSAEPHNKDSQEKRFKSQAEQVASFHQQTPDRWLGSYNCITGDCDIKFLDAIVSLGVLK